MKEQKILSEVLNKINAELGEERFTLGEEIDEYFEIKEAENAMFRVGKGFLNDLLRKQSISNATDLLFKSLKESLIITNQKEDFEVSIKNLHQLKPMLKESSFFEEMEDGNGPISFESQFFGLSIGLVIDLENTMIYVTENLLKKFGMKKEQLFQISLQNLRESFDFKKEKIVLSPNAQMYVPNIRDEFSATRILLLNLNEEVKKSKGDLLVAIPSREEFIMADTTQMPLEVFVNMTMHLFQNGGRYGFSPAIHRFHKDGKVEVMLPVPKP